MKKLMIAFAVVAMAACSQASMVYWQFADSCNSEDYFPAVQNLNGYTAYLITADDWNAGDVAGSLQAAQASVASTDWKAKMYTPPKTALFSIAKSQALNLDLDVGTESFYIVFADGDKYWASQELTGVTVLEDGSISTDYTAAQITLSNATAIKTTDMKPMGDVPEPTSAMLLLLGVAGMALRRRLA